MVQKATDLCYPPVRPNGGKSSQISHPISLQFDRKAPTLYCVSDRSWDDDRRNTWRRYLAANAQLVDRLDHELQQQHDLALVDYEILEELSQEPGGRLRMSDLAAQVLVSRSRLTYRIDRLNEVGFVAREECEDDRRGMWAIITQPGRDAYEQARTSHESSIDGWFFDHMSEEEITMCQVMMERVTAKLSRNLPGPIG